jgi:hypothetical protein
MGEDEELVFITTFGDILPGSLYECSSSFIKTTP